MLEYYSPDYFTAKNRFLAACARLAVDRHYSLPIDAPSPNAEPLTIDVAVLGAATPHSALVLSSGIHGVEGGFGSAVQLAFLEGLARNWRPPEGAALVLLHALNPFGFAWRRRFNEENVDLNRNFLLTDQEYAGAPPLSGAFRGILTPSGFHRRFGLWKARGWPCWHCGTADIRFGRPSPSANMSFPTGCFLEGAGKLRPFNF